MKTNSTCLSEDQGDGSSSKDIQAIEVLRLDEMKLSTRANQWARYLMKRGVRPGSVVAIMNEAGDETTILALGVLKVGAAYVVIDRQRSANQILSLLWDSQADFVLTREDLVKDLSYTELQNLREAEGITLTAPRAQIEDLDALPFPDRSLVDYAKYDQYIGQGFARRSISILATRGCPYQCLYCHKIWPKRHFVRSGQNIFEEVLFYYQQGYRTFDFLDDIFNLDRRNSETFFNLVLKNKLKVRMMFANGLRGDILTPDYIDLMIEAGVVHICLALETASPRLQKLLRKNIDIEKLRANLLYIAENHSNVILHLFTMVGFPTETEEEAWTTLDFVKQIKWLHFVGISLVKIFPNTELARLALEHGATQADIERASRLAYHEPSATTPFSESILRKYQASFMKDYFLLPERLAAVIPVQKRLLTCDELVARYNAYLPGGLDHYPEIVQLVGQTGFYEEETVLAEQQSAEVARLPQTHGPAAPSSQTAEPKERLRILLLDLSQRFSHEPEQLSNMVEAPLGLIYLLTYLSREYGQRIQGKIWKSMIDFDSLEELKHLIQDFHPHLIGIRTLSLYKDFFHKAVALIKQWLPHVPIITGGPYATSEYTTLLSDQNVDVAVLGEGELTFSELVGQVLQLGGKMPEEDDLKKIAGLAFVARKSRSAAPVNREILLLDHLQDELTSEDAGVLATDPLAPMVYTSERPGIEEKDHPATDHGKAEPAPLSLVGTPPGSLAYWTKQLDHCPPLQLPTDRPRSTRQAFQGRYLPFILDMPLAEALTTLSRQEEVTPFMTLLAGFKALLYRYTGQKDLLIGSPLIHDDPGQAARLTDQLRIFRTSLAGNSNFRELLSQVREVVTEAYTHPGVPLKTLVEALGETHDLRSHPPFKVMFAFHAVPTAIRDPLLYSQRVWESLRGTTALDLLLFLVQADNNLAGTLLYNASLFEIATMAQLLDHFRTLLGAVTANPHQQLFEIPLVGQATVARVQAERMRQFNF